MVDDNQIADLSVIVTVVDGGKSLARCLDALSAQEDSPKLEVIVPFDSTIAEVGGLAARYPDFCFLDLGTLATSRPGNAYEEHELFDRRRAGGLSAATSNLLAMIEDRGWPRPDWAREMAAAHEKHDDGVIGGGVDSAAKDVGRWAIFFLDFGRYQTPFETDEPEYVSDTNICYKRSALEQVKNLWRDKYQESVVNWALRDNKVGLRLESGPKTVQQRLAIGYASMAMERIHWGRTFGQVRAENAPLTTRLKWIATTPLLPAVLYVRNLRRQLRLGRHLWSYILATPVMLYLLVFWSIGECVGYIEANTAETRQPIRDASNP